MIWQRSVMTVVLCAIAFLVQAQEPSDFKFPNRPKVPGKLRLNLRERKPVAPESKDFRQVERSVEWDVNETAIIICDMWDGHYCRLAAQRVNVMVPRMNAVVSAARSHGVMIIHGEKDSIVSADEGRKARDQYQSWGFPMEYMEVPGLNHLWAVNADVNTRIWKFLKEHPMKAD